jgi:hypothetical protein
LHFWPSDEQRKEAKSDGKCDTDNLTVKVKRGAATEADGEIEEVNNCGEDSSELVFISQTERTRSLL